MVEGNLHNFQIDGFDSWSLNDESGFREFNCDVHDGIFKIGNRSLVVIMIGRVDVLRGKHFPALIERMITTCKRFGKDTKFIFGGPFPDLWDDVERLDKFAKERRYVEERLQGEKGFRFVRSAERFGDYRGVCRSLFFEDGLSVCGEELLRQDILETMRTF